MAEWSEQWRVGGDEDRDTRSVRALWVTIRTLIFHSEVGKHWGILSRGVIWSNLDVNGGSSGYV